MSGDGLWLLLGGLFGFLHKNMAEMNNKTRKDCHNYA